MSSETNRPVFLMCGLLTVALSIAAFFLIVDFPEKSSFLSAEQKEWAISRIERDRSDSVPDPLTMRAFGRALADWKIWVYVSFIIACNFRRWVADDAGLSIHDCHHWCLRM